MLCAWLALLAPAGSAANPSQTGVWTPLGSQVLHESIHMMLLKGGGSGYHSRILSFGYTPHASADRARMWGWSPSSTIGINNCTTSPTSQLTQLPLNLLAGPDLYCSGHSAILDGRLLFTGGHDEANSVGLRQSSIFDPSADLATQLTAQPQMAMERWYPTNTSLPDGSIMVTAGTRFLSGIVFGGSADPENPVAPSFGDLRPLGLTSAGRWLPIVSSGTPWPDAVDGHSWLWNPNWGAAVMFGGREGAGGPTNQTWGMHLEVVANDIGYVWNEITAAGPPAARTRHSAILRTVGADRRMVVFGGQGAGGSTLGDLRELSRPGGIWTWTPMPTSGSPGGRYGHTAIYDAAGDRMLMFGGLTAPGVLADNEVYALSFATMTWSQIALTGKPSSREGHTLVLDPTPRAGPFSSADRRAVLHGGNSGTLESDTWVLWISGINGDLEWQSLGVISGAPGGLTRHAAMWDETQPGTAVDRLILVGGLNAGGAVAGAWELDANLNAWTPLETPAVGLAGAAAVFYPAGFIANTPEVFTPNFFSTVPGSWRTLDAPRWQQNYPFMFVLPSGKVFCAGSDVVSMVIDPLATTPAWTPLGGTSAVGGASAVMYAPGKIMKSGTQSNPTTGLTSKIEIDALDATTGWTTLASSMRPRSYHNLTMLPNGKVLLTGGLETFGNPGDMASLPVKLPEIWDPATGNWSGLNVLAPDPARRGYHSTALLLPDGRILSAGGEPGIPMLNPDFEMLSIYCPPYLFNSDGSLATRPSIKTSFHGIGYGGVFHLYTDDRDISSVCLIRASSVTHAFNQDQRYIKLGFTEDHPRNRLVVNSPVDANQAPPGDYLLFINRLNPSTGQEVPSIAWWIKVLDGVWIAVAPGPAPSRFTLQQNRPNPVTNTTSIGFGLPSAARVTFEVFDAAGRRVVGRALGDMEAGMHRLDWEGRGQDGRRLPPGVYLYQITAGAARERQKMVLLPG